MSIKIMSRIWEDGPDQQSELLVLLALADWANDDGDCWPSMGGIARKARIEERSARRIVRRLEESGWLSVNVNGGRHGCNNYRINPDPKSPGLKVPRTETTQNPDRAVPPPRTPRSPEPSITIKEPSESVRFQDAWEIFNAAAKRQGWPQAETITPARKVSLKARMKDAGGLDGWAAAIRRAEASDFLSGRTDKAFRLTFDFLVKAGNFAKLTEGNYDNRTKEVPHLRPVYSDEEQRRREDLFQRQLEKARAEYGN